jgi:hypothetical protein
MDPTNIPGLEKHPELLDYLLEFIKEGNELDLRHSALSLLVNLLAVSGKEAI